MLARRPKVRQRNPMLRPLHRILCILFCSALIIHAADKDLNSSRVQLYYGLAEGNYLIGDLQGATRGIEQILRIAPEHQATLQLQTRVALDAGQPEAALETIDRAITLAPEEPSNRLLKALVLGNLNRRDEALELVESVQQHSPAGSEAQTSANQLLGLLQMAAGDWDAAAAAFDRNHQSDSATAQLSRQLSSEAYLEKARAAVDQRAYTSALAALDAAIAVHRAEDGEASFARLTQLRLIRARYLTHIGQSDDAIDELRSLHARQPDNLEILITLAALHASAGQWDALEAVIAPIAAQPDLRDIALYLQGRAALAKGRAGTARAYFEEALQLLVNSDNPLRAYLRFFQGVCLDQLGRPEQAESAILEALEAGFRPESSEDALYASRVLLRTNAHQRAIPILEAFALKQLIPNAEVWAMLGRAHRASTICARPQCLQSVARHRSTAAETLALRGSLLRRFGDLQAAAADYSSALNLDPDTTPLVTHPDSSTCNAANWNRPSTASRPPAPHSTIRDSFSSQPWPMLSGSPTPQPMHSTITSGMPQPIPTNPHTTSSTCWAPNSSPPTPCNGFTTMPAPAPAPMSSATSLPIAKDSNPARTCST